MNNSKSALTRPAKSASSTSHLQSARYTLASPNSDDLADGESQTSDLRDEDGGHGFVEGCAVHVDGGADGDDEAGDAHVDLVLLLKALESHWQGS